MRYAILILLNLPIVLLAILNTITQYKLAKISKTRLRSQLIMWTVIVFVICASFPAYNMITGQPVLKSNLLSWFDIVQTTAIIYLIYFFNRQRQRVENTEKTLRDLHQELSIKLSKKNDKNKG